MSLNGDINGGPAYIEGSLALDEITAPRGRITLTAWNVMLEYPEGFQTESNADLSLTLGPASTLSGRIDVLSGIYREPIVVSRGLLAGFGGSAAPSVGAESSFLANLRLDVTVATTNEIRIDNNYGRLNLTANLQTTGTAAQPGSHRPHRGRARWRDLSGRQHLPDPDADRRSHEPSCHRARRDLSRRDARGQHADRGLAAVRRRRSVRARGPIAGGRSDQPAGRGDAVRHLDRSLRGRRTARAAALGRAAGHGRRLGGPRHAAARAGRGHRYLRRSDARRGRRQSRLAADVRETPRRARRARLLAGSLAERFHHEHHLLRAGGISMRALLLDNEDRSYEFRHEPPSAFGAGPGRPLGRLHRRRCSLQRQPGLLRKRAARPAATHRRRPLRFRDVAAGQRSSARSTSRAATSKPACARAGPRGSEPVAGLERGRQGTVALEYTIEQGRPTRLDVSGFDLPDEVQRRIVERWASAIFDGFLERDVDRIVREHLFGEGRLQARVTATLAAADGAKTLRVEIDPGAVAAARLQIEGNESVPTARVLEVAGIGDRRRPGSIPRWLKPPSSGSTRQRACCPRTSMSLRRKFRMASRSCAS